MASAKSDLERIGTMQATAQEADILLGDDKPDQDAQTRGQNKKLDDIKNEKPPAKKAKLAKAGTMAVTAKEGKALLKGQGKIGDTRNETKLKKGQPKKEDSIQKTMAEAKAVYGELDLSEGRRLRKRPDPPKPALKKAGTMQRTAKEGKAFLKRGRPKKAPAKVEEVDEEDEPSETEETKEASSEEVVSE